MSLHPLYRLAEKEVRPTVEKHLGHWQNLETQTGAPFQPVPGLTIPVLTARLEEWETLGAEIEDGGKSRFDVLYAQRDAFWGQNAKDPSGAWYWLGFYKKGQGNALKTLPHSTQTAALAGLAPALSNNSTGAIPGLFEKFVAHWTRVDAALVAGGKAPLKIGQNFDLAALKTAQTGWNDAQSQIEELKGQVPQWHAERDLVLGDFAEADREADSLISMLYNYHFGVETQFPGSTYAQTLPRIFPAQPSDKEPPHFAFNFASDQSGTSVWFHVEVGNQAQTLFLKEGAETFVKPFEASEGWHTIEFPGLQIAEELDRLEWRGENNQILAWGKRDENLPKP